MGIMTSEAVMLASHIKKLGLSGRCLSYGRQVMFFNIERHLQIMHYAKLFNIENGKINITTHANNHADILAALNNKSYLNQMKQFPHYINEDWMKADWISDDFFFNSAGFETYHTMDATAYEQATFVYNLNHNNILDTIKEPYDLVLDTGTIEHVFDTRNFFKNLFDATKVGGYIFHCVPSNNHVDHGFYQISPTLLHDYYRANNYNIIDINFCGRDKNYVGAGNFAVQQPYQPGILDKISFGGLDDRIYITTALIQKTENSTWDVVPEQGTYNDDLWKKQQS